MRTELPPPAPLSALYAGGKLCAPSTAPRGGSPFHHPGTKTPRCLRALGAALGKRLAAVVRGGRGSWRLSRGGLSASLRLSISPRSLRPTLLRRYPSGGGATFRRSYVPFSPLLVIASRLAPSAPSPRRLFFSMRLVTFACPCLCSASRSAQRGAPLSHSSPVICSRVPRVGV